MQKYEQWHVKALIDRFTEEYHQIMNDTSTPIDKRCELIAALDKKYKSNPSTQDVWEEMFGNQNSSFCNQRNF